MTTGKLRVLGIDVPETQAQRWADWLAPERQPFFVAADDPLAGQDEPFPLEVKDTFELYGLPRPGLVLTWLDGQEFFQLPKRQRAQLVRQQVSHGRGAVPTVRRWHGLLGDAARQQADGHRFVWWPQPVAEHRHRVLSAFVTNDRLPSAHREVPATVWRRAQHVLPEAERLAGTFPTGSGPNCLGTVMAVAGVPGAEHAWMQREPFEQWLSGTRRGGRDHDIGTVFVWRNAEGAADHAAVTLGGGWALHKPSQGWMSPTKVLTVDDLKRRARWRGLRLHRYSIQT
jgi:hypothetical protein